MLLLKFKYVTLNLLTNEVDYNAYPYEEYGPSTMVFSFIMYEYHWFQGFKCTCLNVAYNLVYMPMDLIKLVVTWPFCFLYNAWQVIWNAPSLLFGTCVRIDNWLNPV
jgi:hypothetical protein